MILHKMRYLEVLPSRIQGFEDNVRVVIVIEVDRDELKVQEPVTNRPQNSFCLRALKGLPGPGLHGAVDMLSQEREHVVEERFFSRWFGLQLGLTEAQDPVLEKREGSLGPEGVTLLGIDVLPLDDGVEPLREFRQAVVRECIP
jgi:hypothetical protein